MSRILAALRQAWREAFCVHHFEGDRALFSLSDWGEYQVIEKCAVCGKTNTPRETE
jgi:hypothetical protein